MRFTVLGSLVLVVVTAILLSSCGGGGSKPVPAMSWTVKALNGGPGFGLALNPKFILREEVGGYAGLSERAIPLRSGAGDDRNRNFALPLTKPALTDVNGTGVYSVAVIEDSDDDDQWANSETSAIWRVSGDAYCLGYGAPGALYPGWTIWNFNTTKFVSYADGMGGNINIMFLGRGVADNSNLKPLTEEETASKIAAIFQELNKKRE